MAQSVGLCVSKSVPNTTGESCPQVHYSHWHWANWLMWLCSSSGMTLKWLWGKRQTDCKRGVHWQSQTCSLMAQHWHISGCYLSDGLGRVVYLARPLWSMLISFPASRIFKVTRLAPWYEMNRYKDFMVHKAEPSATCCWWSFCCITVSWNLGCRSNQASWKHLELTVTVTTCFPLWFYRNLVQEGVNHLHDSFALNIMKPFRGSGTFSPCLLMLVK